jgi:galactokinase
VLVVHSGVPRTLEGSPYALRRADSEHVAAQLGLRVLRDATFDQVRDLPRGRHAVTEMVRVREFAEALRTHDLDALGPLMLASHASSRDDMEVSIPALDTLVECLVDAGAYGARLTGAGFGGCVVAIGPAGAATEIAERATASYRARTALEPVAWLVRAAGGADRDA